MYISTVAFIAVCDNGLILSQPGFNFVYSATGIQPSEYLPCGFAVYISYISAFSTSWTLVAVTFDR